MVNFHDRPSSKKKSTDKINIDGIRTFLVCNGVSSRCSKCCRQLHRSAEVEFTAVAADSIPLTANLVFTMTSGVTGRYGDDAD